MEIGGITPLPIDVRSHYKMKNAKLVNDYILTNLQQY